MSATASDSAPMLGAYAAKQCPVRLFRQYDPTEAAVAASPDASLQQLFDDGIAFEAGIAAEIVTRHEVGQVAVIPGRDDADHDARRFLTDQALSAGVPIILGALLQPDHAARRLGEVDILLATGRTVSASGRTEYRAIDVKSHRCTSNSTVEPSNTAADASRDAEGDPLDGKRSGNGDGLDVHDVALLDPEAVAGYAPRYREDDCLQLAHYHRLLQAHGYAEPDDDGQDVRGGILGSERVVAWFDLQRPMFATVTPQETGDSIVFHKRSHSRRRSALDRYDFEFAFRLDVVDAARARTDRNDDPIVRPIAVKECGRCDWRDVCHADLVSTDDVSLVNGVGYPEWRVHRFMGVETCRQLAELDIAEAVLRYADSPLTAQALTQQIHNARAQRAGGVLVRDDWDPTSIPSADIEIDLDLENAQRVYLWGARLTRVPTHWPESDGDYVPFASFDPIDETGERLLVDQLWAWLDDLRRRADDEGLTLRAYGYSTASTESLHLRRISDDPAVHAFVESDEWVDLLPFMRAKFWSNDGHGLKVTAVASGFAWRDDEPGGWASVGWYEDAIAGRDRQFNIDRLLAYNEDDCIATATLRRPVAPR